MRAEQASLVPHLVRQRLGSFDMADLAALNEADWLRALRDPKPAHRMPETMAVVLLRAVQRIGDRYGGDAARMWSDAPSSARRVQQSESRRPAILVNQTAEHVSSFDRRSGSPPDLRCSVTGGYGQAQSPMWSLFST
jgi:hypothetical protein